MNCRLFTVGKGNSFAKSHHVGAIWWLKLNLKSCVACRLARHDAMKEVREISERTDYTLHYVHILQYFPTMRMVVAPQPHHAIGGCMLMWRDHFASLMRTLF